MFNGQAEQDKFILNVLKQKRNGWFLEIGSNHPVEINNTYILESQYDWKGIMIEYVKTFLPMYEVNRPKSIHIINDATKVDYASLLKNYNAPSNIDYLQIDLEPSNGSTIKTLEKLDTEIFDNYKFATITFEHDIYTTNFGNTRERSREIFNKRGYVCVFADIHNQEPKYVYEDWYVHPELVDMTYINNIIAINKKNYVSNPITIKSIDWRSIEY
jgi:hypothetical protein